MRTDLVINQQPIKVISSLFLEKRLRTKINSEYIYWEDLITWMPLGSVSRPLLLTFVC